MPSDERNGFTKNNIMTDLAPPNALGPVISPGRRCNFFIAEEAITVQTFKHTHCV